MRHWGRHARSSPLYTHLVDVIADDPDLIAVLGRIEHNPPPNLLFAGVQYLLMGEEESELSAFYGSLVDDPRPPEDIDDLFRDFVLGHEDELVDIGRTRYTQTNECRRCVALMPMVWMAPFDRFHLIDLGASAGLNLALDHYCYFWDELVWGPDDGVPLYTEMRGAGPDVRDIEVLSRVGLDLNPLDPDSPDDRLWLNALIWPEQHERRSRLEAGISQLRGISFDLIPGDVVETLEGALDGLADTDPAVVMNSFALMQLDEDLIAAVDEIIDRARGRRPVYRVSMEIDVGDDEWPRLVVDDGSGPKEVGRAHHHGEWVELFG